ncbi:MAG: hypothetical protein ABI209_01785 [Edaphobacter sp.]
MPLLEIQQTSKVTVTIALEESVALKVDKYAAFINAPADEVVTKALEYVFSKDREFQQFAETPSDRKAPKALRIRKVPVPVKNAPVANAIPSAVEAGTKR